MMIIWKIVELSLGASRRTKDMFSMDSDKQIIVKCYTDTIIVTDINKFYLIKTKCFIKMWCSGLKNILCWILDEFQND
jgi:hypothetical protein